MPHAMKCAFIVPTLLAAMVCAQALAADDADAERGRKLAYACMGCHGIEHYKNAYPKYSVPKLGGQSAAYIAAALAAYDQGARWHPTMKGYAKSLSQQDRADLGAWFASRANKPAAGTAGNPPAAAEACSACHGTDGFGTLPENPTLAGQHADYLEQALHDYRRGKRSNPIMDAMAAPLTDDDIRAIAAWFSKQPGLKTPSLR